MFKKILLFLLVFIFVFPYCTFAADISAKAYVVLDSSTNTILNERSAHLKMPMASTTKIMTCLIACESSRLNETVTITNEMLNGTEGTLIYLKPGNKITLNDLVYGAMLASGNDAANAIAFYLSGSIAAFSKLMNSKAKELGMLSTSFVTPSGLDDKNHYSTAYDMALLASAASKNETLMKISACKNAEILIDSKPQTVTNHNKLLKSNSSFVGLKTGYTSKAGRCLVSIYNYKGSKIVCVTLNAPFDWNDHKILIDFAKRKYTCFSRNEKVYIRTIKLNDEKLECVYSYNVSSINGVWVKLYYYPIIYYPIKKGDIIGYVEIYTSDSVVSTVNLISNENK